MAPNAHGPANRRFGELRVLLEPVSRDTETFCFLSCPMYVETHPKATACIRAQGPAGRA